MTKLIYALLALLTLTSCDPVSVMDANVRNASSQNLSVIFFSSEIENDTLVMDVNETLLFQEGFDVGGTFLEPYLIDFDSVLIINRFEEVLKVYTPDAEGKNIFNVQEDWSFNEPSKRVYEYLYQINDEDLE